MLLMLLIGWIVLLPALVVAGLYIGSSVLGRRRAASPAYEDLFADEQGLEDWAPEVTPEAITGSVTTSGRASPTGPDAPGSEAPVGAGY